MLFFIEALACAHEVQQLSTSARCLQAPAQPYDTCLAFGTIGGRGLETVDAAKSTMKSSTHILNYENESLKQFNSLFVVRYGLHRHRR